MRRCRGCGVIKPLESNYYGQWVYPKTKKKYFNYQGKCKKCISKQNVKWQRKNIEKTRDFKREWGRRNTDITRYHARKPQRKEYMKVWRKENPDKIKQYNFYRQMNKHHDITEREWKSCKEHFDNSCAYCGISDGMAKERYGNYLHKDHADHDGSNNLNNCIPACKSCNSSKHNFVLEDWYLESESFSEGRLNKINNWLSSEYKKHMEGKSVTIKVSLD